LAGIQAVLGERLVGLYLEGSLAAGSFDQSSDIDFIAVTDQETTHELFLELQAMHDRLQALDTPWAIQLEGSYISLSALRRYDPANATHPNLERGLGERLKMIHHDESGVIHRWILREHGIVLLGPPPQALVDPVSPDDLRQAMRAILPGWGRRLLAEPAGMQYPGYQSFIVLSICRILYTLQLGEVVSKAVAARWAQEALAPRWTPLIESAWVTRNAPQGQASPEAIRNTLDFIRYALERLEQDT
jgi:hypothetical protein